MQIALSVGQCPFCEAGSRILYVHPEAVRPFAVCDECDTVWPDPTTDAIVAFGEESAALGHSGAHPPCRLVTAQEARALTLKWEREIQL
jgi:hypothetical protein